jgi:hypothetical protein
MILWLMVPVMSVNSKLWLMLHEPVVVVVVVVVVIYVRSSLKGNKLV